MLITKQIQIHMGHRVPNHKSKCRNLHGHTYVIEVGLDSDLIETKGDSSEGMVMDFGDLKQIMMEEIDARYDHGFVMYEEDEFGSFFEMLKDNQNQNIHFVPFIPTAENLAKYWHELMKQRFAEKGIKNYYVKVWETLTSSATYGIFDKN